MEKGNLEELAVDLRLDFGNTKGAADAIELVVAGLQRQGWHIVRFHETYEPLPIAEAWTP